MLPIHRNSYAVAEEFPQQQQKIPAAMEMVNGSKVPSFKIMFSGTGGARFLERGGRGDVRRKLSI
jgi:hypothetical protein